MYFPFYCEQRQPPSFLSIDTDGRVLRFDSLSKVLSSGLRIGFATGPKALIDRITLHMQCSVLHTSGLSQAVAYALVSQWGAEGWARHIQLVQNFYRQRRDVFLALLKKHLTGLAEWNVPTAGMFVWIKLAGVQDSKALIEEKAREKKVLLMPGQAFVPSSKATSYVRASFSIATETDMDLFVVSSPP